MPCYPQFVFLAPVVQRPENFIQWISHYSTVSICAKISVFPRVQANMHTLTTAKFGSVRKPWTTFNVKNILDPDIVPYPPDTVIRPLNNCGLDSSKDLLFRHSYKLCKNTSVLGSAILNYIEKQPVDTIT